MGIGVVIEEIVIHCLHYRRWHLRPARPIKIRHLKTVMNAPQGRKLLTDVLYCCHLDCVELLLNVCRHKKISKSTSMGLCKQPAGFLFFNGLAKVNNMTIERQTSIVEQLKELEFSARKLEPSPEARNGAQQAV